MKPVPVHEWDPSLQHVIEDMDGRPINIHSLMANHPSLLNAWWNLRNYLVNGGELEQRHCELVILRVAARLRSWYEWASHVVRGIDSGLSLDEIEGVRLSDSKWGDADQALLDAVDDVADNNIVSAEVRARLALHFTDRQVMDIIVLHGMYLALGCMLNTWNVELDDHVRDRLPAGTNEQSFNCEPNSQGPQNA